MDKLLPRAIAILNLTEDLTPELRDYFTNKNILLIDPISENQNYNWTHILTRDVQDFKILKNEYKTVENDIRIISLSNVDDLQEFTKCNGKLILDELWLKSKIGGFILDKFLQGYGGVALGDSYPTFKEKGSFNIINPFNTGEYLDRLVQSAYLDGMNGLLIKTFFDHLVMYLSGLKSLGKLGMPIEVAYGSFEDIFAVQLHFYTKNLVLEDVTASLSGNISRKAEDYLLNITVKSCDFFDFTLLKEVDKTVVTGLWTKDNRIQIENRGLLFNELTSSAVINNYPTEGITSFQMNDSAFEDFSDRIILPSIASSANSNSQTMHSSKVEEEVLRIVRGELEKEEENLKVKGSKSFDVDQFSIRVSAGVEQNLKSGDSLRVKSLKNDLPQAIKTSFNEFTTRLKKSSDEITENDLKVFKDTEVPKLIKQSTAKEYGSAGEIKDENERLRDKVKLLETEVKNLLKTKKRASEASAKAIDPLENSDFNESEDIFKEQVVEKMHSQKRIREEELMKLATLIDKETMLLKEAREKEREFKKLQIDFERKETVFKQEIEKLNGKLVAKDFIVSKTKEGLSKLVQRKDSEIAALNEKINQTSALISNVQSPNQNIMLKELERRALNAEKMSEIYKAQLLQRPADKVEDVAAKEENRKLNMMINQLNNQSEASKRELARLQDKKSQDQQLIGELRAEKNTLDQLLKKTLLTMKNEEVAGASVSEKDHKKLQAQFESLDKQFKESLIIQKNLENKLQDALKLQKKDIQTDDTGVSKAKTAHLEGNVRKLTADLIESKKQLAEMKKETNKLRQEKTALQNQIDRMTKEAEKAKAAAPKKPGAGGKAA